jgi:hypothetical protein
VRNKLPRVSFRALLRGPLARKLQAMKRLTLDSQSFLCSFRYSKVQLIVFCGVLVSHASPALLWAEPPAAALPAFNAYVGAVESRLARQHSSQQNFLAAPASWPPTQDRLRGGAPIVEELTPTGGLELPGALLHHWRATAFAPGAKAADFEPLMRDVDRYSQHFAPQIVKASVVAQRGDFVQASIRVRQKHIVTVVLDTAYDIRFGRLDPQHGYTISRSTGISEIGSPGAPGEHALEASEEHGFLWRLNTYWSYEERDGGLYLQVESISLTRTIPRGMGWIIQPFIESIPRDSLEFTLRSTCNALENGQPLNLDATKPAIRKETR